MGSCKCCASRASVRAEVTSLSSKTQFLIEDSRGELVVDWSVLKSLINPNTKRVYASGTYTCDGTEDEIYCSGITTVTLAPIIDVSKSVTINASGDVTVSAASGNTIQVGAETITGNDSATYGPNSLTSEWRLLGSTAGAIPGNYS